MTQTPGLFGQIHSNRDYKKQETWGKNQFNSSFPASLVAYMHHKQIEPVYLTLDKSCNIKHKSINGTELEQMIGNAVPVKLAEYVANSINKYLVQPHRERNLEIDFQNFQLKDRLTAYASEPDIKSIRKLI